MSNKRLSLIFDLAEHGLRAETEAKLTLFGLRLFEFQWFPAWISITVLGVELTWHRKGYPR